MIHIIGGGLAGSEAAWQAAALGVPATIHEMRPVQPTAVHQTDRLAELVCSNSFRGDKLDNAVGLLKEEMRRLGSLVMQVADRVRVPAGAALAVDRAKFAEGVTEAIEAHPLIRVERGEIARIPASDEMSPVIVATGPLTSEGLSADIAAFVGHDHLAFFDAISPIVLAETIDMSKVFRQSRWDRSLGGGPAESDGDYLNCPLTKDEYLRFSSSRRDRRKGSRTRLRSDTSSSKAVCPIEVMAHRGVDTLRFGPMKPAGLTDPRTGRWPYAVVQLRQDTLAGDHYSLVGFQTQLKWGEQARVLRMIPGLEQAEFVRFGMIHRNTYINAPTVLTETWQTRGAIRSVLRGPGVRRRGLRRVGGVRSHRGPQRRPARPRQARDCAPPRTTAIGALGYYVSHADPRHYDPSNITFGIIPPLASPPQEPPGAPAGHEPPRARRPRAMGARGRRRDLARRGRHLIRSHGAIAR